MGIVIDIIVVVFILASIALGYKKGLLSLGIQLVATIAAFVITLMIYKPVGNLIINHTSFDESIQTTIETNVNNMVDKGSDNAMVHDLIESAKQGVLPQAARKVATAIIYAISVVIIFIVLKICISLIDALANLIASLPILKQFNSIGGIIYGALRGLIITYVILLALSFVIAFKPDGGLGKAIDSTKLTKAMMNNNVLSVFLK